MIRDMPEPERPFPISSASPELMPVAESPLLHTKLRIPGSTPTLLARPRLTRQLQLQPNGHITLVSAPAGFGKTTLVTEWVGQQEKVVAWLTLDEQDNDPILFWRYLIAALQTEGWAAGLQLAGKRHNHATGGVKYDQTLIAFRSRTL